MLQITENEDGTIVVNGKKNIPAQSIQEPQKQLTIEDVYKENNKDGMFAMDKLLDKKKAAWEKLQNIIWYFQKDWKPIQYISVWVIEVDNLRITSTSYTGTDFIGKLMFKEKSFAEEAIRLLGDDIKLFV